MARSVSALLLVTLASCAEDPGLEQAEAHLAQARSLLQQGKLDDSLAELERALARAPDHLPIQLELGIVFAAQGRLDEAIAKFRHVLERDPGSAAAYAEWGEVLLRQQRAEEAIVKARRAAQLDPSSARAVRIEGRALVYGGRFEEAVQAFERASALDDRHPSSVLAAWGFALDNLGRVDAARQKYEAAVEADPPDVRALYLLGTQLAAGDDVERGIRLLRQTVGRDPSNPVYLRQLGTAYLRAERFEEAHDLLRRAAQTADPSSPIRAEDRRLLEAARSGLVSHEAGAGSPNVLLVVIDTLRADHVHSYGYARRTTEHLDALASQGVLFENAVSQAPWTAPSVATILTALYPSVHGLDGGIRFGKGMTAAAGTLPFAVQKVLGPSQTTLAEQLRRHGYRTAGFVSNAFVNSIFGFAQGFDIYDDEHDDYSADFYRLKRRGAETNRRIFSWLSQRPAEPFFLFVHYVDPHWPYVPPPPFGVDYVADYRGSLTPQQTAQIIETDGRPIRGLSPEDLRYIVGLYDGEIRYADWNLGQLIETLRGHGLERELLTVVTSDHGEEFLDHGSGSHGHTLYEEQIRVPLVFHYPGRFRIGRVPAQVRLLDLMPTVLELVGAEADSAGLQGRSLVALLEGRSTDGPGDAFGEATYRGGQRYLRTDQGLKLIDRGEMGGEQLFDLRVDPHERQALASSGVASRAELRQALTNWADTNRSLHLALYGDDAGDEVVIDEQTLRRLEALGYTPGRERDD